MPRLALLIGWKDCLVRFQSRVTLIFVVVLPLALTIVSGLAFQGFEVRSLSAKVALVDSQASGLWSGVEGHKPPRHVEVKTDLSADEARAAVENKEIDAAIIVGPRLHDRVSAELIVHENQTPQRALAEAAFEQLIEVLRQGVRPAVEVERKTQAVGEHDEMPSFNSFTQAVLGNGVMFILLNCITAAGITIVRERRQNTLARLLISPVSRPTLLLGKTLGVFFIGVVQAVVIFGFGAAIGVLDSHKEGATAADTLENVVGVAAVTLLLIVVACAMGLTVSTLARREETAESLGVPIAIVLTALGGGMFPVERAPPAMQFFARLLPSGQAMEAYHKLLWSGEGVSSIALNLLVLAGFAAVFFAIGVSRLRWE
jgi:ABC-type multidrug transport system permease subunit